MVCAKFVQIIYVREWKIQQEGQTNCVTQRHCSSKARLRLLGKRKEKGEEEKRRLQKTDVVNHFSNIINFYYILFIYFNL